MWRTRKSFIGWQVEWQTPWLCQELRRRLSAVTQVWRISEFVEKYDVLLSLSRNVIHPLHLSSRKCDGAEKVLKCFLGWFNSVTRNANFLLTKLEHGLLLNVLYVWHGPMRLIDPYLKLSSAVSDSGAENMWGCWSQVIYTGTEARIIPMTSPSEGLGVGNVHLRHCKR